MGAGRLVRDQLEGLIVDPLDVDAVAAALTKLADDESLRQTLAKNAAERAREFTWANAGTRLYDQFCTIACP
jgi:glycosyltransferase involved in cell wall biosynthesis